MTAVLAGPLNRWALSLEGWGQRQARLAFGGLSLEPVRRLEPIVERTSLVLALVEPHPLRLARTKQRRAEKLRRVIRMLRWTWYFRLKAFPRSEKFGVDYHRTLANPYLVSMRVSD